MDRPILFPMRKRFIVVLKLARLSVPGKIAKARDFAAKISGNANFQNPTPPLNVIATAANNLENAWTKAQDGSRADTELMYEQEAALEKLLIQLGHYVEDTAMSSTSPAAVIESAGMSFKVTPIHTARTFSVSNGRIKGNVTGRTKSAGSRAGYIWQFRIKGTSDWATSSTTIKTTYTFTGLISGSAYEFRVAVVTKQGQGDWSDPLELVVL